MKKYATLEEIDQERTRIVKEISRLKNKSGDYTYQSIVAASFDEANGYHDRWSTNEKKINSLTKQLNDLYLQRKDFIRNQSEKLDHWLRRPSFIALLNKKNKELKISDWRADITGDKPIFENFDEPFSEEEYDKRVFFRPVEDRTVFTILGELFQKINY